MIELERAVGEGGEIRVLESRATGARFFLEDGVFQAHATPQGRSLYDYVHLMAFVVQRCRRVLVLGCGGGTLATMLFRKGQDVTVVDNNPVSFELARRHFAMPASIPCVVADFRDFLRLNAGAFDGVTIDVGGPQFDFEEEFDRSTCETIRQSLSPRACLTVNLVAPYYDEHLPDAIAGMLLRPGCSIWAFDQPGQPNRNVILASIPRRSVRGFKTAVPDDLRIETMPWILRRPR